MATSPTVLAGAPTSTPPSATPEPVAAKIPVFPLLIAVAAGVVIATLGVGGVVYYLAHTGRLPMQGAAVPRTAGAIPVTTHVLALEPMLVNLSDTGGSSYVRVAMTLRVADGVEKKDAKTKDEKGKGEKSSDDVVAAIRDTALTVLGRQTAEGLLATDGKEHLKAVLKAALAEHNADLKVMDIFFTDFLVQR